MKITKKANFIFLVSLLALSGCAGTGDNSSSAVPVTLSETSSDLPFENVSNVEEKDDPFIDYLGTEPLIKTDGYILYYANYGQNAGSSLVTQELVSQSRLSERLTERIASDLSPDLCEKPENVYYLISKNMFEDLTKYIDTDAPQWQEYSEYLSVHKYNNGNYFYPTRIIQSPDFLAYNSEQPIFTVNGGKSPIELWREGKWNFETLSNILNSGAKINVKYDSSSFTDFANSKKIPFENLLTAAGLPVIDTGTDGKYFSNLGTEEFFGELSLIGNYVSGTIRTMNSHNSDNFLSINIEQLARLRSSGNDGYGVSSNPMVIVPYPASEDGRYLGITAGYLIPKRAKNIKAAANFINGSRIAARLVDFSDGLTDEDKEVLTALSSQSYAGMIESYSSYISDDTKKEADKLWHNSEDPVLTADDLLKYHSLVVKSLEEVNPK